MYTMQLKEKIQCPWIELAGRGRGKKTRKVNKHCDSSSSKSWNSGLGFTKLSEDIS